MSDARGIRGPWSRLVAVAHPGLGQQVTRAVRVVFEFAAKRNPIVDGVPDGASTKFFGLEGFVRPVSYFDRLIGSPKEALAHDLGMQRQNKHTNTPNWKTAITQPFAEFGQERFRG